MHHPIISACILSAALLVAHGDAIAQRSSVCVGEANPGPVEGPIPRMRGIAPRTQDQEIAVSPGPAIVLIRMCAAYNSYEINILTQEKLDGTMVSPGSCIDFESGKSTAKYGCSESEAACQSRDALIRYCRVGNERRVSGRYWAAGFWAPYSSFEAARKVRGAFQLPVGIRKTTLTQLQTSATYEVCADRANLFNIEVDGAVIPMKERCAFVQGKAISAVRLGNGKISGTFSRINRSR